MIDRPSNSNVDHDLLDQLVERFTARVRMGETPSIAEYQEMHPEWKDEIHDLLSSVAMIEGLKKQTGTVISETRQPFEDLIALKTLGEYRIIRELGRGGMGIVLEAVHESLGRRVAIKILPNRLVNNDKNVERFTREARSAATLHHNNIVSVFGVGQSDGYYYYVMEFVDGCGLDQVMRHMKIATKRQANETRIDETLIGTNRLSESSPDERHDPTDVQLGGRLVAENRHGTDVYPEGVERFDWAARIIADIADALDYAHEQGVLHRDIKPGNLLLDPSGRVWLTDFGLVKDIANQTMTMAGDIIGTPQYMAPESFEAKYDVASETYCLGATLYELVTLRPLFEHGSAAELIRRVTTTTPVKPRKIDSRIPQDLSTIIEKATARDPRDRYVSAEFFRDDLHAFLQDRPISAKPASIARRVRLWSKRNPWQAVSAMLLGLVAVLATAGFVSRSNSLRKLFDQNQLLIVERDNTQKARELAEQNATKYREQFERAEANVDLSLEMFDEMFKQMVLRGTGQKQNFSFDGFQELSGIETAISKEDAEYLENMLVFVQKFARENSENTALAVESAKSFRRVANIYHLLGKFEEGRSAYRKSIRLYDKLIENKPGLVVSLELSQTANELGLLTLSNGNFRSALQIFNEVRQRLETSDFAGDLAMQMELVRTLNLMGGSAPIESSEALIRDRDADNHRDSPRSRRGFRSRIPRSFRKMGNENLVYIHTAIKLVNRLIENHGVSPELLLERAKSYLRLAELQYWMKTTTESLKSKLLAVEDLSKLIDDMPDSPEYQSLLAQAWSMPIGQDDADSLQQLMKADKITSKLCESFPSNTSYLQLDADVNYQLGQLQQELKNPNVAIEHYRDALISLRQVWRLAPRNLRILGRVNDLTVGLAELLIQEKRYDDSRELLTKSLRRINNMQKNAGRNFAGRSRVGRQYQLLAQTCEKLGDIAGARRARRLARDFRQKQPPSRNPSDKHSDKRNRRERVPK